MAHTPTPWDVQNKGHLGQRGARHEVVAGINRDGGKILPTIVRMPDLSSQSYANAEFIVRAVNCYDTLVSELQEAQTIIHRLWEMTQNYNIPDSAHWPYLRIRERLAALAKVMEVKS